MYRLTFHPEDQTFVLQFEGAFDVSIGKAAFLATVGHPGFAPPGRVFWDMRGVTDAKVEFISLFNAVQSVLPHLMRLTPESRAVVLVENDIHFGMARMLEQIVDAVSPLRVRVTRTIDEAARQLDLPPDRLDALLPLAEEPLDDAQDDDRKAGSQ